MKYIVHISIAVVIMNAILSVLLSDKCIINKGVAFGIDVKYIEVISLFLSLSLMYFASRIKGRNKYVLLSLGLLGFANLVERFLRGGICDYLYLGGLYVNLIDIFITSLVILSILIHMYEDYGCKDKQR